MKVLWVLLALLSFSAYADEYYKCYSVKPTSSKPEVTMKIDTTLFTNKISSVTFISKIKATRPEESYNPFNTVDAYRANIDQATIEETAQSSFTKFSQKSKDSEKSIILSDAILKFERSGHAYYFSSSCFWIFDCTMTSDFYKCDKL